MTNKADKSIQPFAVYNVQEVADFLKVDPKTVYKISPDLNGKVVGNGFKFLGENLLRYMGSPSIAQMKPDTYSGGVPTSIEEINKSFDKSNMGVAPLKQSNT